jgi:hypothetical protein
LIDLRQRPCGPHLSAGYHVLDIRIDTPCMDTDA